MDGNTPLNIAHTRTYEIEQALRHRFGSDTHVTIHVEPTHKASE
jgi:divalent metal cation (Fe/Co/Zn/Cd) transporter